MSGGVNGAVENGTVGTVVHQVALKVVPTSPSFEHHLFCEIAQITFAVALCGVTRPLNGGKKHSFGYLKGRKEEVVLVQTFRAVESV